MTIPKQSWIVYLIWIFLTGEILFSLAFAHLREAFVAGLTLGLTFLPILFAERFRIRLPISFGALVVVFLFATLFLGEAGDFYNRFWWWDILLHSGSAIGFGLIGFIIGFMMFEGDRFRAPPIAIAIMSFCFAVAIGAMWEVFEFTIDQTFGTNMQKSGLVDTMWDLIVDMIGAAIGSMAGLSYLKGEQSGMLQHMIDQFVKANKRLFRKGDE